MIRTTIRIRAISNAEIAGIAVIARDRLSESDPAGFFIPGTFDAIRNEWERSMLGISSAIAALSALPRVPHVFPLRA